MNFSQQYPLTELVEVDEAFFDGKEEGQDVYHSVESRYLQVYLDEYSYHFNQSLWKKYMFDNLIQRMVKVKPSTYETLIINVRI